MPQVVESIAHWKITRPRISWIKGRKLVRLKPSESPIPGRKYRLHFFCKPHRFINDPEVYLENVEIRIVFNGWKIRSSKRYQNRMRFYTSGFFTTLESKRFRKTLTYNTIFEPDRGSTAGQAHFKVTKETGPVRSMSFSFGLYGSLYNREWYTHYPY